MSIFKYTLCFYYKPGGLDPHSHGLSVTEIRIAYLTPNTQQPLARNSKSTLMKSNPGV